MNEIQYELEEFTRRIIFMSMFNDIEWEDERNRAVCISDLHRGAILFVYFIDDEQEANWIFAQFGRYRADKVQLLSPIFGKQLACDCGQPMCHAAVLDELIRELVTSGAMTNEGREFPAAPFSNKSIPDRSSAPLWYASSTSSVYNETQSAWQESWTGLCIEMRSFQCRCFWKMLPDNSVLSQSFRQAGWDVAWSLDANLNPDFNLQNPLFFAVAVGLLLEGRAAVLNLPPLDDATLVKLAQSQQRVKGYWIWIQSQSTATSVWAQAEVQCLLRDAHRIGDQHA